MASSFIATSGATWTIRQIAEVIPKVHINSLSQGQAERLLNVFNKSLHPLEITAAQRFDECSLDLEMLS